MEGQINSDEEIRAKVQSLVDLAFEKGLAKAIDEAKASRDPFLIDKFHDTLTDELRQELIETQHKA
jgi:hypothetical protein